MTSRKMRIAADIAHGWARNFKLGDTLTKFVLMAVTLYVNDEGSCFVGITTLADDTELSQNTIRRKLAWLEEIGAIKRAPQWLDARGRRTSDPLRGGKRTSDEIKLCLDADPAEIEARARGEIVPADTVSPPTVGGLEDDPSPPTLGGLNPVSPSLALHQPSQSWEGLNLLNNEQEDSSLPSGERGNALARPQVRQPRPTELPEDWLPPTSICNSRGKRGSRTKRSSAKSKNFVTTGRTLRPQSAKKSIGRRFGVIGFAKPLTISGLQETGKMERIGQVVASLSTRSNLPNGQTAQKIIPIAGEDRLPAQYAREIDRDLHCVVSFWEGGGVGAGTPVLRRPFKASERGLLERRVWELRCAVAPFEARSRDALLQAISGMLGAFPAMQRFDQHAALGIAANYLMIVRQQPHWAIVKACEMVRTNKAGFNPDFCPSEPQFVTAVAQLVKPYADALRRVESLVDAKVDRPPAPKPTREEGEAKLGRPLPQTVASNEVKSTPMPVGDGNYAERVLADLAARKARRAAGLSAMPHLDEASA
jgi:Helix-turn-helix domain